MEAAAPRPPRAAAMDDGGEFCVASPTFCAEVWWCRNISYSHAIAVGVAFWSAMYLALLVLASRPAVRRWVALAPSKFEKEDLPGWVALYIQSTFHASFVVGMVVWPLAELYHASAEVRLDVPGIPASTTGPQLLASARIANASFVFFCYMLVDTVVTTLRREMTVDYLGHHVVFVFLCLLIQHDCLAPYMAGCLLVMEISTIFLNGFCFLRNRLGYGHWAVKLFFAAFAAAFFACRLLGTTYIAVYWCWQVVLDDVPWVGIPRLHLLLLCASLACGVVLQFFWAAGIARKVLRVAHARDATAAEALFGRWGQPAGKGAEAEAGHYVRLVGGGSSVP